MHWLVWIPAHSPATSRLKNTQCQVLRLLGCLFQAPTRSLAQIIKRIHSQICAFWIFVFDAKNLPCQSRLTKRLGQTHAIVVIVVIVVIRGRKDVGVMFESSASSKFSIGLETKYISCMYNWPIQVLADDKEGLPFDCVALRCDLVVYVLLIQYDLCTSFLIPFETSYSILDYLFSRACTLHGIQHRQTVEITTREK